MINRNLLLGLICFAFAACAPEEVPEFCSDHTLFHAEHAASNAVMSVTMTEGGLVQSEVRLPLSVFDEQSTMAVLQDADNVYALQTAADCTATEAKLSASQGSILAEYSSQCGADNKLGQVDVLLFDSIPELNEVEVSVFTPATKKYFAISRQCASAIFRFE